jgi:hypothetical protein
MLRYLGIFFYYIHQGCPSGAYKPLISGVSTRGIYSPLISSHDMPGDGKREKAPPVPFFRKKAFFISF